MIYQIRVLAKHISSGKNSVNMRPCCINYTATTEKGSSDTKILRLDKSLYPYKGDIAKQVKLGLSLSLKNLFYLLKN